MKRAAGFTLVEVLVALVIVAFGMSSVLAALSAAAGNTYAMREKSIAEWIALNQIAVARVALQAPSPGTTEGTIQYAGGNWRWQQTVDTLDQEIGVPGILRITVQVQRAPTGIGSKTSKDSWIVTVAGFRGNAVANSNGLLPTWGVISLSGAVPAGASGVGTGTITNPVTSGTGGDL